MNSITTSIHSFVDLITNSSSETYISANQKSVETVKKLIDGLLLIAGSQLKSNDLFDVYLSCLAYDQDGHEITNTEDFFNTENEKARAAFKEKYPEGEDDKGNEFTPPYDILERNGNYQYSLTVKAKDSTSKESAEIEKILNSLENLFDYETYYG